MSQGRFQYSLVAADVCVSNIEVKC